MVLFKLDTTWSDTVHSVLFCLTQLGRSAAEAAAAEFWRTIFFFFSREYFHDLPGKSEAEDLGGLRFLMLSFTVVYSFSFDSYFSHQFNLFFPKDGPPQILRGAPVVVPGKATTP